MRVKGFIIVLILSLVMISFMGCDNGTTTRIVPPFPLTITDLLNQAIADGIEDGSTDAIGFATLDRNLRFFDDGMLEVWSQGLGQMQLAVSGRWEEDRTDPIGNKIHVFARRDATVNAGGTGAAAINVTVEEGDLLYSFRYIVVNHEIIRILQVIPGRIPTNGNRSEGHPSSPAPNGGTVQVGEFNRMGRVPYFRHP